MKIRRFLVKNRSIIIILSISMILRILFSLDNVKSLFIDIKAYENSALLIINKGPMSISTYLPPAYPFFIALVFKLAGIDYFNVYIVQSILGMLTTFLIYLSAKNIFNERMGVLSAGLSLLYWPLTLYSGVLLSETLFLFLVMSGFYCFLRGLDSHKSSYFIASGALFSLSALTRSINLMLLFLLPLTYVIINRKLFGKIPDGDSKKPVSVAKKPVSVAKLPGREAEMPFGAAKTQLKDILNPLLFMLTFCLVMSPWVIRNFYLTGHFIPVDSLSGVNLYIGNNERANGFFVDISKDPMSKAGGNLHENDRILKQAAVKYIAGHPLRFIVLTAWRAFLFITYDLFEVDWVLATYINKNILFQSSIWKIFYGGYLFYFMTTAVIVIAALLQRRAGKPVRNLLYVFLALLVVFSIQRGLLSAIPGIYAINYNANGWFDFIYNCDTLFFALALAGTYSFFKNEKAHIAGGFVVYYFGLTAVFYIQARYRLPIMPFMAIAAAYSADKIISFFPVVKSKLIV